MDIGKIIGDMFGGALGKVAETAFGKAMSALAEMLYSWALAILNTVGSWWLGLEPLATGEGSVVGNIADTTRPLVAIVGTVGLIFALIKVGRNQGAREDTTMLIEGLMRVAIASAIAIPGAQLLMQFSADFAPWIFQTIVHAGHDQSANLTAIMPRDAKFNLDSSLAAAMFFVVPFVIIGSLIQAMMAMGCDIAAAVLAAILPITAAASTTAQGTKAFGKQIGWILSCILFKPAAAIIYAFGISMISGGNLWAGLADKDGGNAVLSLVAGFMTIILACFSLPALISLIAPMAGVIGSSGGRFISTAAGAAAGAAFMAASGAMTGGASTAAAGAGAAGNSAAAGGASTAGASAGNTAAGASTSGFSGAGGSSSSSGVESVSTGGTDNSVAPHGAEGSTETSNSDGAGSGIADGASGSAGEDETTRPLPLMGGESDGGSSQANDDQNLGASDSRASGADEASEGVSASADQPQTGSDLNDNAGGASSESGNSAVGASASRATGVEESSALTEGAGSSPAADGAAGASSTESETSRIQGSSATGTGTTSVGSASQTGASSTAATGSETSTEQTTSQSSTTGAENAQVSSAPMTNNSSWSPNGGGSSANASRYVQDLMRSAGEETENAINPEGAGQ